MSKPVVCLAALALVMAVTQRTVTCAAASEAATPETRLDTYVTPDGTGYFALRLVPNVALADRAGRDVVILFDTSASQTGVVRDKALEVLDAVVAGLARGDQVALLAVDLQTVPLTAGFVPPQSDAMKQALTTLRQRVPLGATDLPAALAAAAAQLETHKAAKALIYIGDGVSSANFLTLDDYRRLIDVLADQHVPVTSYGIGVRVDSQLLASLANQTGGMLAIDSDSLDAKQIGAYLASAVRGTVVWPVAPTWPEQFEEIYPARVPPLRSDRDTIVVGKGKLSGEQKIALSAVVGDKPQALDWTVAAGESNADFAFLLPLVESSKADDGMRLATVGTPGLMEVRRILDQTTEMLAKLGGQAVATGNLPTAERLIDEALRRDPNDPTALGVKKQLAKLRADHSTEEHVQQFEIKRFTSEQAAPPSAKTSLKLAAPAPPEGAAPLPRIDATNNGQGQFLGTVEEQRRLITAQVRAEVDNELREARSQMAGDPAGTEQGLKLLLERVDRVPELPAETRAQLRGQLEAALREAKTRSATKEIVDIEVAKERAAAVDRLRIADGLVRNQEKLKQLMDRFDSLMDEGRYGAADNIGDIEVPLVAPDTPIAASADLVAHETGARMLSVALRDARQKAVIDTLASVEVAHIPFPDDQPVIYPDAAVWEELTERRKKYTNVDLATVGPAEAKINKELGEPTTMEFIETPLADAIDYLKDLHGIEIQLDTKALEEAGIGSDTPVTRTLKGISLRSALRLMLGAMDLTYVIKDEVLLITTTDVASEELVTKAYPVADLVIQIQSMGGMGGGMMGGGMMGGMGGGMGGGMMGGGMGGGMMGGGMGGGMMGGGMGGGMFSVPDLPAADRSFQAFAVDDDLKLTPTNPKGQSAPAVKPRATQAAAKPANGAAAKPASPAPSATSKSPKKFSPIELSIPEGTNPESAWSDYFTAHKDVEPERIRETARQLMHARQFDRTIAMINVALRSGQAQPWMYEGLALAMQLGGAPNQDIERALMSGVDFGESAEDLMYVAQYMARIGLEQRALRVFHQVSVLEPLRPEPYLYGLRLAQSLGDVEGIRWSSLGVLKQAWPKDKQDLVQSARRAAGVVVEQLKANGMSKEATEFQAQVDDAKRRDCIVKVSWTGDADVDLMVEEPSGTLCSFRMPRTTGGGVMLGDSASGEDPGSADGTSETYVCPEAFDGTYRVLVRRVWGKVTAGKVTVDLYAHYGSPEEKHMRHQIPLGDKDQLVVFEMTDGRRKEALEEQKLANAAAEQAGVNQAILAQQIGAIAGSSSGGATLTGSRQGLLGIPFIQQAVGYRPVITVLPSGTRLMTSGVVSADRRYVRVSPSPLFSGIGQVTTFNIQSGATSTSNQSSGQPIGTNPNNSGT